MCCFFFKQKTAYEIEYGLVGSEMCIRDSLDLAAGPQAQARLFRGADDLLCVKLNHAVADGGGVIEYAGLLAATYRALGADPGYVPRANLTGARGLGQVFRRIAPPALLAALRHSAIPTPAWGFPAQSNDLTGRTLLIRRVPMDLSLIHI